MSANRAKNSRPELLLRKALWHAGHRGYRLHYKKIPGRPDITFVSKKVAIFVHGCFWHRCPICNFPLPKTNRQFWEQKFCRNVSRDLEKTRALERLGWTVITIRECELRDRLAATLSRLISVLN